MDWNAPTLWWLLAGLLVVAELLTGTFYLLMVALGAVAGAIGAHAGVGATTQILVASLGSGIAVAAWHLARSRRPQPVQDERNRDINLDVGQQLQVPAWEADGSARVSYRGAMWSVRHDGGGPPVPGAQVIVAVHGSELRVRPSTAA